MFWRRTGVLSAGGTVASLPSAGRFLRTAGTTAAPAVLVSPFAVSAAVLPAASDDAGAAVQLAPVAAAVLVAPASGSPYGDGALVDEGAQVRSVRAAGSGVGVRAGGPPRSLVEFVPGTKVAAGPGRVRRPAAGCADLNDARHAARLRPQEHRAHGQRPRRRDPGLTLAVLYIPVFILCLVSGEP